MKKIDVVFSHSQPTASKQIVWKLHLDLSTTYSTGSLPTGVSTPWSPSSFERVQKNRRRVASPWLQNWCTMVGHWSPRNKCLLLQSSVPQCGRRFCPVPPIAFFWTMTVTTTLRPFGDHGDPWASTVTLEHPRLRLLNVLCTAFERPRQPCCLPWASDGENDKFYGSTRGA